MVAKSPESQTTTWEVACQQSGELVVSVLLHTTPADGGPRGFKTRQTIEKERRELGSHDRDRGVYAVRRGCTEHCRLVRAFSPAGLALSRLLSLPLPHLLLYPLLTMRGSNRVGKGATEATGSWTYSARGLELFQRVGHVGVRLVVGITDMFGFGLSLGLGLDGKSCWGTKGTSSLLVLCSLAANPVEGQAVDVESASYFSGPRAPH